MTKEVILTIYGFHAVDGEADEPVEVITPGQYFLKNGKHYILFEEILEGLSGVIKSRLKISDGRVELMRGGLAGTRIIFEEGSEYRTFYNTPIGALEISFYTEEMKMEISEEQIDVEIGYSVIADGRAVTESRIRLNVCPKELKKFAD